MNAENWLVVVIIAAGLAGGLWRTVQLWRDSTSDLDAFPESFLRAFPAAVATASMLVVGGGAVGLLREHHPGAGGALLALVTAVGVVLGMIITVTVATSGKPVRFVPPHLRHPDRGE